MAENSEKKKELTSVLVELFPEVEGRRITSDKRCGDDENKMSLSAPVTLDEDVNQKLFNRSTLDLLALGIRQAIYNLRKTDDFIKDKVADGVNPADESFIKQVREIAESELFIEEKAKRESKSSLVKEMERRTGMTINTQEDLDKAIAKMVELQKTA